MYVLNQNNTRADTTINSLSTAPRLCTLSPTSILSWGWKDGFDWRGRSNFSTSRGRYMEYNLFSSWPTLHNIDNNLWISEKKQSSFQRWKFMKKWEAEVKVYV